ncbi:MAG: hypothetical protein AB3N28_04945 [Kordiimonas sp.]
MVAKGLISNLMVAALLVPAMNQVVSAQESADPTEISEIDELAPKSAPSKSKPRLLASVHEEDQPVLAFDVRDFKRPSIITADVPLEELEPDWRCEGNACDAFLPSLDYRKRYENVDGQKGLNSVLGGVAGAVIGEEIAGAPGAIVLGAIGAASGYRVTNKKRWEEEAKRYEAAYQRGDDIFYNPANRIPNNPHWLMHGPGVTEKK